MSSSGLEKLQKELKWVQVREEEKYSFLEKLMSKGVVGFLVPAGCLATAGVLTAGLYRLIQKDREKQQKLMRYRVAVQGITIALAMTSILSGSFMRKKSN